MRLLEIALDHGKQPSRSVVLPRTATAHARMGLLLQELRERVLLVALMLGACGRLVGEIPDCAALARGRAGGVRRARPFAHVSHDVVQPPGSLQERAHRGRLPAVPLAPAALAVRAVLAHLFTPWVLGHAPRTCGILPFLCGRQPVALIQLVRQPLHVRVCLGPAHVDDRTAPAAPTFVTRFPLAGLRNEAVILVECHFVLADPEFIGGYRP